MTNYRTPSRSRPGRITHGSRPRRSFPGVVPIETLQLGRTEQVAVASTGISVYAAGFEIFVTARIRPGARDPESGMPDPPRDLGAARRSFRFGLQLSDGRKVISRHGGRRPDDDAEPAGPILRPFLGGGGPRSHFSRWRAWPLPPPGPLESVCEWPTFGIAETRASIDAARRSVRPWPEDEG